MAEILAELDVEMDGHVIHGLGAPTKAGDATRVDNAFVPLAASGTGSPGASFEAAAKDHVHPMVPGQGGAPSKLVMERSTAVKVLHLDTVQKDVLFEDWRNFDELHAEHEISVAIWADMRRDGVSDGGPGAQLIVVVGAETSDPASGNYILMATSQSDTVERVTAAGKAPAAAGWQLCRVLGTGGLRAKNIRVEFGAA